MRNWLPGVGQLEGVGEYETAAVSGNLLEERYRLISRQFESMGLLDAALRAWTPDDSSTENRRKLALKKVEECERAGGEIRRVVREAPR